MLYACGMRALRVLYACGMRAYACFCVLYACGMRALCMLLCAYACLCVLYVCLCALMRALCVLYVCIFYPIKPVGLRAGALTGALIVIKEQYYESLNYYFQKQLFRVTDE